MDEEELKIIQILDAAVRQKHVRAKIDSLAFRVEQKLTQNPESLLAWEPIPLSMYGVKLPETVRSSWIFILRARASTGAERHPNSRQRMMSYRGSGDLQIMKGEKWRSNFLVSDPKASIETRWVYIPPNIWHQAVVHEANWVVVSFHTVPEDELIEERSLGIDSKLIRQRRYLGKA